MAMLRLKRGSIMLVAALAVVLVIEAWGIQNPSLWADEIATISGSNRPLGYLWHLLQKIDMVHGTYYLFMHYWGSLFGFSPFWLRLPSALAATATVGVVFQTAKQVSGERLAWISLVVATILPRLSWAATEGRSYAFSALLGALIVYFFVRAEFGLTKNRRGSWIAYGITLGIGINLFFYLLLLALTQGLWLLLKTRRLEKSWLAATGIGVLIGLWTIVYAGIEHAQISWLPGITDKSVTEIFVGQYFLGSQAFALLTVGLLVALAFGARRQPTSKLEDSAISLWSYGITVPAALIVIYSMIFTPIYDSRYLTFATPMVALLLALALEKLLSPRFTIGALVLLTIISLVPYFSFRAPDGKPTNWAVVASAVEAAAKPGDAILYADYDERSPSVSRIWMGYPKSFANVDDLTRKGSYQHAFGLYPKRVDTAAVLPKLGGYARVLVLGNTEKDANQLQHIEGLLSAQGLHLSHSEAVGSETLNEFVR